MKIYLAPMEGITDFLIRQLFTEIGGYDQCTTEFIRVTHTLLPDSIFYKYCPELKNKGQTSAGTPVFVQLLGGRPEAMALNAQKAAELGALGIDLNFGCPAPTVNNHDGGATILKNPYRVYEITKAVRTAVPASIAVTVKMRLGFSHPNDAVEIAQAAESAGASRITIHARTRDEAYRPPAHWDWLKKIAVATKVPLVANGDIWSREDYLRCYETCGVSDVMLGRGAFIQPDLALQIKENSLAWGWAEILVLMQKFIELANPQGRYVTNRVKQWLRQLVKKFPQAEQLFTKIKLIENPLTLKEVFYPLPLCDEIKVHPT